MEPVDPHPKKYWSRGSVSVEQTVLVVTVAVGVVSVLVPVGMVLFDYHRAIEFIVALPIP